MTLTAILLLALAGLLAGQTPPRWRTPALAALSILALFALQPASPIRNLDFWLPLAAISLALATWAVVQPPDSPLRPLLPAAALAGGLALLLSFNRNFDDLFYLTATRPPQLRIVALALLACGLFVLLLFALRGPWAIQAASLLILGIFIVLKSEPLSLSAAAGLRTVTGQDASLALATDLRWLGFSYLAFRLLSILRDSRAGRANPASPLQLLGYALFFPALSAGPIDRLPRFLTDLERRVDFPAIQAGLARIFTGLLKKFALADTLALVALTPAAAGQAAAGPWSWALLYAYALRLYFDFSGYTDIAIGIGLLAGVRLPENFAAPYLKTNLTAFWNSWHITLAHWFRAYFFNPLTRWLRQRPATQSAWVALPAWAIILIGQTGVMLLIGVWHGLTWNFAIWGLWHAAGLFIHNRWSEFIKPRLAAAPLPPRWQRLLSAGGWLLTFHYVTLGWVWFALPAPADALDFLLKLAHLG